MMRWWLVALGASLSVAQANPLSAEQYAGRHTLRTGDRGDQEILRRCLAAWGQHPFDASTDLRARFIESSVRIMGFGRENRDDDATSYPQLILVRPSVNVMTKTTYELHNPNGWYCFDANVTVMGKSVIRADCRAQLADGRNGVAVVGASDESGAVAVLGAVRVERVGECKTDVE